MRTLTIGLLAAVTLALAIPAHAEGSHPGLFRCAVHVVIRPVLGP